VEGGASILAQLQPPDPGYTPTAGAPLLVG
jgi:hypothetical protein